jgi:glycosyltransferase involved in cell wall biosynthesis
LIAIIIPYYKKKFFRKTLNSLANQTDKRFRVYIGDDASPENPKDLVEEYSEKIDLEYKRFKDNLGQVSLVSHWKRTIEMSRDEEWIIVLGDDDYFSFNLIESFYFHYDNFLGKTNVVRFAKQNIFDDKNVTSEIQYNPSLETGADSYYRRITGKTTSTLSEYAFTRTAYEKFGFYDYPLAWHADNRAWIEFSEGTYIYSINNAVVSVICSSQSITGSELYKKEKREANLSFYKYLITNKLYLFNKNQSIRVLHKYENEMKHKGKLTFKLYIFLLPYYIYNFDMHALNQIFRKIIKSLF